VSHDRANIEFTDVEIDVLRMIVGNMSDAEIAFALDMEQSSVEQINRQIFRRLGAADRAAAAEAALRLGLVKLEI
jgi:DNA-binding NarL/FixJ family response regulator